MKELTFDAEESICLILKCELVKIHAEEKLNEVMSNIIMVIDRLIGMCRFCSDYDRHG